MTRHPMLLEITKQNKNQKGQALPVMMFPMYSIASWNIRGLNRTPKQSEVRQVIIENLLNVCAILESHVDVSKLEKVCAKVCGKWEWTFNGSLCTKGSRIILGWNDDVVDVMVLSSSSQAMHT